MFKNLNPFRVLPAQDFAKMDLAKLELAHAAQSANEYASALALYQAQHSNLLRKVLGEQVLTPTRASHRSSMAPPWRTKLRKSAISPASQGSKVQRFANLR